MPDSARWNHNIHYHRLIRDAVAGHNRILDIGCGEGTLCRELAAAGAQVVGIDLDKPSLELAKAHPQISHIEYIVGDALSYPFEPGSFDAVVSVATLHHIDAEDGLRRCEELLRPGGRLAIVGLARHRLPADLPRELVAAVVHRLYLLRHTYWEHAAPTVWPPPETYGGMRRLAADVLPGARFRRRLLWRYSIVWTKPT